MLHLCLCSGLFALFRREVLYKRTSPRLTADLKYEPAAAVVPPEKTAIPTSKPSKPKKVSGLKEEALIATKANQMAAPRGNTLTVEDTGIRLSADDAKRLANDLSSNPILILSSLSVPDYTAEALDAKLEVSVAITVFLDEHGQVISARLLKKVGFGMDERLTEMAMRARFEPRRDARGIAAAGRWEIKTKLELRQSE